MLTGRNPDTGEFQEVSVTSGGEVLITGDIEAAAGPTDVYKASDIDEGTTSYFGFIDADGNWYILKLTDTQARYAVGTPPTSAYTDAWTARASLTYYYFYEVF